MRLCEESQVAQDAFCCFHNVPHQHVNKRKRKQKSHSHGRHHPSTPQTHVQKVESRQKNCKNRCRMRHTQENTEKNDAKCRGQHVFAQCSPAAGTLFKPMRKQKQSSITGEVSAKSEFQHMPAKESYHPASADATAANNNSSGSSCNGNCKCNCDSNSNCCCCNNHPLPVLTLLWPAFVSATADTSTATATTASPATCNRRRSEGRS